jgi:hypothetical protein
MSASISEFTSPTSSIAGTKSSAPRRLLVPGAPRKFPVLNVARRLLILSAALLLLFPVFLCAQRSAGKKSDDPAAPRNLTGNVLDKAGHPVPGAVVYLKNTRNLAVSTFITADDGFYRFNNLSPDIDYQVRAEANGSKSPARTLSSFDTHKQAHINLKFSK